MYTFMVVSLFLGYALILIFGLLHLARELVTGSSARLIAYSYFEADRDDELPGATQTPSNAQTANCAADEGRHKSEP